MLNERNKIGAESRSEQALLSRVTAGPEGKIFIAGVVLLAAYFAGVVLMRLKSPAITHSLLKMSLAHIFGGRAAGISSGYAEGLRSWLVILANCIIETYMVLLFYPLFVFSYRKLIVVGPLQNAIERTHRAALALQPKIVKYGVPGLLLFVWFPFWMTGPVVGAIIGFLIGLRWTVNLSVVLCGTYLAIATWGIVLKRINDKLEQLGPEVPVVFVAAILIVAVSIHIRYAFSRHAVPAPEEKNQTDANA
jgi:uncharacterized membrane protein